MRVTAVSGNPIHEEDRTGKLVPACPTDAASPPQAHLRFLSTGAAQHLSETGRWTCDVFALGRPALVAQRRDRWDDPSSKPPPPPPAPSSLPVGFALFSIWWDVVFPQAASRHRGSRPQTAVSLRAQGGPNPPASEFPALPLTRISSTSTIGPRASQITPPPPHRNRRPGEILSWLLRERKLCLGGIFFLEASRQSIAPTRPGHQMTDLCPTLPSHRRASEKRHRPISQPALEETCWRNEDGHSSPSTPPFFSLLMPRSG